MYPFWVRSFRSIFLVLLALAWVPLTSHCKLEAVAGLEFLHCADEVQSGASEGEPCEGDTCCEVEFAKYPSSRHHDILPGLVAIASTTPCADLNPPSRKEQASGILTTSPPELATSWQFHFRTALPARAPSLASW